jgi:hypothetical protein
MTPRLDLRFLGLTTVLAATTFGCAAPDRGSAETPQVFEVALTAATPSGLPQCTKALYGTTAATESPAGIWTCQGTWVAVPCTNGLAGAVAYASATNALWACTGGQWVNVVLPAGPQGQPGQKGDTGAPGKDGKAGATSIVEQTVEPPGPNCADGGTRIASGVDGDGGGSLSDDEIKKVTYVCNGAAGPAGTSGRPGMLVTVSPEPAGANCPAGGQRIGVGVDTNGNGRLDDNESTFSFVCNGGAAPPSDGGSGTPPPTVTCVNPTRITLDPAPNTVVEVAPGSPVLVSGTIADADGARSLRVNGVETALGADGAFIASVTSRYGLNHVVLEAADHTGFVHAGICSFLVADQFVDEGAPLADGVALRLGQAAIDDGDRTGPINSLADALATALNSEGIHAALDTALTAANPLKPLTCDEKAGTSCFQESEIRYISVSLPGPNSVSASPVAGGVKVRARFEAPVVRLRVSGHSAFIIPFDATGDVTIAFVELDTTFDLGPDATGRLRAGIRPNSTIVNAGDIDTNFPGADGFIINLVADFSNGTFKSMLRDSIQDAVTANFNSTFGALASNLSAFGLAASFTVPRFDGTGATPITFDAAISSVDASAARALIGTSTRFTAPAAHTRQPNRVPLPPGAVRVDPDGTQPVAVAEHVGVLQQALQAHWRGGGLDGTVAMTSGANIAFVTPLPPIVFVKDDGSVGIDLRVDAAVSWPGIFDIPIHVLVFMRGSANVAYANEDLVFSRVTRDEFQFVTDGVISRSIAQMLEDTLATLMTQMAERSMNDALPRLPIPAFTMPEALGAYGLPAGAKLGLTGATLATGGRHAVLRGGFGVR